MEALHSRRTYDDRIQEAVCDSGDRDLFPELHIPRSTIRSWIHRGTSDVVSCDFAGGEHAELVAEIEKLRRRTALFGAVAGLLIALLRASKIRLDCERLPEGDAKRILLRAIERARRVLPLSAALGITRLSASRYHNWCRAKVGRELNDQPSSPRVFPSRLTPNEVMPHSAFHGQTPNEIFFGTGDEVAQRLTARRRSAREERMEVNRVAGCSVCVGETSSGALLLQRARSRMS